MGDKDEDNIIISYLDKLKGEGISELEKQSGNKILDKVKATYRIGTAKKPISPKIYKSGWKGGSRGKIKTFKVSNLGKKLLGKIIDWKDPVVSLVKDGINSEEFFGSLGSTLGSLGVGAATSAALGTFFPGIGHIAGFCIGVGASALGSLGGEYLGKWAYNRTNNLDEENEGEYQEYNDDLSGGGETGGIEFEIPHEIDGFKKLLFFGKLYNQNIIFKNEFSNISEILDVANRFLINKNQQFTSINQVFQTIMTEIYGGYIGEGVLPYVSLNFNNKALLYSIMPNYYKKTLVGNILGYLDYFLKGFVNGGFFKEEFVNSWYLNKNINLNYLNTNFVNLKKYIYYNKSKIKNYDMYMTVYDLGENISKEENNIIRRNSLSAFRIIGIINDDIFVNNNIVIPNCSFRTESDFNLFSGYSNEIIENKVENNKELEKTEEALKRMKAIINILMPQIPYYRGYFNILDMITFSIHYISTMDANAVYPNFSESFLFKSKNGSYITMLPPVFPPLPIKKQKIIILNLTFSYVINNFLNNNERNILNITLSEAALKNEEINFQKIEEILNILENKYYNYLSNLINNKEEFEYRTKRELHIDEYLKNIQFTLQSLSRTPKILYLKLFNTIKESLTVIVKENKKIYDFKYNIKASNINESEHIDYIKAQIKLLIDECNLVINKIKNDAFKKIEEILEKEKREAIQKMNSSKEEAIQKQYEKLNKEISDVKNKSIEQSIKNMEQNLEEQKQKVLRDVPYNHRNEASSKIDKEISKLKEENIKKIKNDIESHFEEIRNKQLNNIRNEIELQSKDLYQKILNNVDNDKKDREKNINERIKELNKYINEQNNKILDIEETIKNNQILKYANIYDKIYLVEKINLSLIGYYEDNNQDNDIIHAPIRGGCLSEINNKLNLRDISNIEIGEISKLIYRLNENKDLEEINLDGKNYFKITMNLFQGNLSESFCQSCLNFNGISEKRIINSINNFENKNISDEYNNSLGVYKILMDETEQIKNKKDLTNKNIFGENALFYLKNDDNIEEIAPLIQSSMIEIETENDLNPFLISIMNQNRELAISLIDYASKEIINSSNESKYTPLHFACLYNYYEIADSLVKKGAKINVKTRNHYYTPLDILIAKGNYETLELLLNNKEFANLINEKNSLNSTPFHKACQESMIITKLLLKNRNRIKDRNGNIPEHYAFFSGRIDIYNQIASSDIKEFNEYISSIRKGDYENLNEEILSKLENKNEFLDCLYDNLNKGKVSDTKKIIKFYQNNKDLKKSFSLNDNKEKIIINMCKGRNPQILSIINEVIDFDNIPIAAYIGKYGLISFIEEMKNMNINMFSELDNKGLLDFAIENKNEDIIIEFFKNIEEISNELLSKYLTKIIMRSKKLFFTIYNYILSDEKYFKNKIKFDYLYNKDSLPNYFNIFLKLNNIDINSLNLNKIKENCRDSVILELQKNNYQIKRNISEEENEYEKSIFQQLLEKNSSSKFDFYIFEHDVSKIKNIFEKLKNNNLFLPHQIVNSKKIWMLKYLPKDYDLFIKNDDGKICFEQIHEDFENFNILLDIFKNRELLKEKQMHYFLKALEIYLRKIIKKDKKHQFEIVLKIKLLKLMEYFEENTQYLGNYCNDKNNNLLHIISQSYYMDNTIIDKFLSFLELIEKNIGKQNLTIIFNQQNNLGNTFLFNLIDNNHHKLSKKILNKYFDIFDLSIRNYKGNTFLHYLMLIKDYDKNILNFITEAIKFNKYFIISEDNNGNTPFHMAANKKCNDSLFLMSNYFPLNHLEMISNKGSLLHHAAISNSLSTLRLIVECFKIDINIQIHNKKKNDNKIEPLNLPNKSTPIYCAGLFNCLESFDYLLSLGANPFIQDEDGNDAIDMALINGDRAMLNYISKTYSFINSNGKYLLSIVKNVKARHILYDNFFLFGPQNINIINSFGQNLLMICILKNNYRIISFLLSNNINIENTDSYGRNILHYCANANSLTSCWVILSYLYTMNKKSELYNLLFGVDEGGETALYYACRLGRLEISYFILLFIELNKFENNFKINHIGLLPIHIAIINENFSIALLLKQIFNISDDIIKNVSEEYKLKINKFYETNLAKENEKMNEIYEYLKKQSINFEKLPPFIEEKNLKENNGNDSLNNIINLKEYYVFNNMFPKCLSNKIFVKYQDLLSINLICIFYELYLNENYSNEVKKFFNIISSIEYKGEIKSSTQWKLIKLFTVYIIPNEYYKLPQINDYLTTILSNDKLLRIEPSHPLFYWIDSIIISGCEGSCRISIEDLLDILMKFINIILKEDEFLNNLNYVKLSMKAFQFINNLNKILSKLDKDFSIIQIKYLHCIPPLLENEIDSLLNQYPIIHHNYNNRLPIYTFIKDILSKKNISSKLLEASLITSDSLIQSTQINYLAKEEILLFCKEICNKFINDDNLANAILSISSISENLCSKFGFNIYKNKLLDTIKKKKNKNKIKNVYELKELFNEFLYAKDLEQFTNMCKLINILSISQFLEKIKLIKNENRGRNINELLPAFGREKFPLSKEELNQLELFEKEFEKTKEYIHTEFVEEGKILGKAFKENPTIENFSKLIKIVNCGIFEVLKIRPYLIQNLIVFSFYLHYINKNNRENYKGRLGQILTGEGKSLIIAQIALISALMGEFVDIITSTSYLANRDQQKFKELYKIFGVSSNAITENNPNKEAYNGIILYGTNTDFEFTLLREGTNCEEKMFTVPLGQKVAKKREFQTVIVDESDNLFIDTALNSARIAYTSRSHFNWVYYPIFYCIKNNIKEIKEIRKELEKINLEQTKKISDLQLDSWIKKAFSALEYKKGEKYIVRYNEEKKKKEVQIIQLSTGRVNVGSRWMGGLHEFIEVKEGIEPETESNTIASISHPSFFSNYKIIFGLTGTIGNNIEREEILNIYHLDSFDVPPNFASQRKIYPTILFDNKETKEDNIINEIRNTISKGRPVLVLLLTIEDSINFSNKLKKEGINNLILNDVQKEKEEYIILYAGKPRSVVVATNAAGRGTDIILSEESLNFGGLHVIMGFYPENNRVEFQGIGRAGRQGQVGSAQVIFSKDENFFNGSIINSVNDAELFRFNKLKGDSVIRLFSSKFEMELYKILNSFFNKLSDLTKIFADENSKILFNDICHNKNIDYNIFSKKIIENFKIDWAEYFNSISKRATSVNASFDEFLNLYAWENISINEPDKLKNFIKKQIDIMLLKNQKI